MSGISLNSALGYSSLLTSKLSTAASSIADMGSTASVSGAAGTSQKTAAAGLGGEQSGLSESAAKPKSAADKFLEYMEMSDEEKLKYALLAEMGISKDQYDAMTSEQRVEVDKKIADRMAQIAQTHSQSGAAAHGVAAKLQTFINSAQANEKKTSLISFEV